jgi:hypothetical protein
MTRTRWIAVILVVLLVLLFGLYFYYWPDYREYRTYRDGSVVKLPANACYFDCADKGFFQFKSCVTANNCAQISQTIN